MIKIRKMFFAWQLEKEKAFLEEKARQGLKLIKIGFGSYYFEEGPKEEVVFQFDFRPLHRKDEEEYLALYKDWEFVQRYSSWYYFRKAKTEEDQSIFSNVESKRKMFGRLIGFLLIVGFPLYYQTLIFFPNMEKSTISDFYRFFRPFVYIVLALHSYAVIKLFIVFRKLKKDIRQ